MTIHIELFGGPFHEQILTGHPDRADVEHFDIDEITCIYWETRYASPGSLFSMHIRLSPRPERMRLRGELPSLVDHRYRISGRLEDDGDVYVMARYVGVRESEDLPEDELCPWYERLINPGVPEVLEAHPDFPSMAS